MRPDGDHRGAVAGGPDDRARFPQVREQRGIGADLLDQGRRPGAGADVEELGRGRVGDLRALFSGEPVREQVGNHQQAACHGQPALGRQLVDRVERQELQPGGGVQLLRAKAFEVLLRVRGPLVPVVHRVPEQRAVRVEQPVVDGPGVDADAVDRPGFREPVQHLLVEVEDVPVQCAGHPNRPVHEPVALLQYDRIATDLTDDHPAAGRAEVDGGDPDFSHRRHRRKAAATPASTGTCSPVVSGRSPAHNANTAAPTCSGSTSRFSSVRLA